MLARTYRFRHTGNYGLASLLPKAISGAHLFENFLLSSVGFSKDDEAISTTTKVTPLEIFENFLFWYQEFHFYVNFAAILSTVTLKIKI